VSIFICCRVIESEDAAAEAQPEEEEPAATGSQPGEPGEEVAENEDAGQATPAVKKTTRVRFM